MAPGNSFQLRAALGYSSSPESSPQKTSLPCPRRLPVLLPQPELPREEEKIPITPLSSPEVPLKHATNLKRYLSAKRKATAPLDIGSPSKRPKQEGSETPSDVPPPAPKRLIPFPEKPAVVEERTGEIEFRVVNNDGARESTIILTGLKCIFQKQLPKMPKDYIARLVYDRTHLSIAIVKKPLEVVG